MRRRRSFLIALAALNFGLLPATISSLNAEEETTKRFCACDLDGDGEYDECCKVEAEECNGCIVP